MMLDDYNSGDAFNSNMKKLYKFDILFGGIRPYLKKAGVAPFDGLRAGTVHAFYPKNKDDYMFSLITMTNESFFEFAVSRSGGSTRMPSVSADDLLNYRLPYNEQLAYKLNNIFFDFSKKIIANIEESQKLAELRDWLLPMLMNGQVTVGE